MRTTLGRKLPKISSLNQFKGISKHLTHLRDKPGELMFNPDIQKRYTVQTGSTKKSEKPESSMLAMMVDDQKSGKPRIIVMHTHVSHKIDRYF